MIERRCGWCGGPQDFLAAFPFITALTLLLGEVGPSEIEPDGTGSWICRDRACRSHLTRVASARDLWLAYPPKMLPAGRVAGLLETPLRQLTTAG